MRERCGCPDCDPPITGCLNPLLEEVERLRSLRSECAVCEKCGHVQAEPNWCHKCGHRTTTPDWAKPFLDAWCDRQNLREAISDGLADMQPGVWPHSLLTDALKASEARERQ